jgi:hypothetical protein
MASGDGGVRGGEVAGPGVGYGGWLGLMAGFLLGSVLVFGQGSGSAEAGVEGLLRGAARDIAYTKSRVTEPGGTPEEKLWQVLVLFGVGDSEASQWSGKVAVSSGDIHSVDGYRLELPHDRVLPEGGWKLATKIERVLFRKQIGGVRKEMLLPKGLLIRGSGSEATRLSVETNAGNFSVLPMGMYIGETEKNIGGRVHVQRLIPATDLGGTPLRQHDMPSITAAKDGTVWATWMSYHDRREELNFRRYKDSEWTRLIPVPRADEDLWRPHVTTDADGTPWLIWSEQEKGNWDLYAMPWEVDQWGGLVRLTSDPLPDIEPMVARADDGTIYVVWQAMRGRHSQIRLKSFKDGKWSETVEITDTASNEWEPSVAVGPKGTVWIAWDRYSTSYDVLCRSYSPRSGLGEVRKVASTRRFEAHASVTVDGRGRPWLAWERGAVNWGKDLGAALGEKSPGTPLGLGRTIEVAVLDNNVWKAPAGVKFTDPLSAGVSDLGVPQLYTGPNGNIWMVMRRCYARQAWRPMAHWESYLTRLDGERWTDPILLPDSLTRRSIRMGLTSANGRLWAFWPSENRRWDFTSRPFQNRVIAGSMELPGAGAAPVLKTYQPDPDPAPDGHPNEPRDVATARAHRMKYGNTALQIVRGDLHRHTELSPDSNIDEGTIVEFYRYMIDAADMDFGASTDHQGGGHDYWNTLTQKMADMYYFPRRFTPLYAYERNPGNPHGHRNIIHLTRDYAIVPFFQNIDKRFMMPDSPDGELLTFNSMSFGSTMPNDTKLLLEAVKKSGGIAIPHTSGSTAMGTDWHASDPEVDVAVEIYQGDRMNYEHKNAPRGIQDGAEKKAVGGYQEPGLVWNAWKKGYRLGVIASSDHFSTHISYAMVYTPGTLREQIFESLKRRHTYGATDNIVLEFWVGDHMMDDKFEASANQRVRVRAIGTGEISAVRLIRDGQFIYEAQPGTREVDLEYVDTQAGTGSHWYYARIEQANGELAWSSPVWVTYK